MIGTDSSKLKTGQAGVADLRRSRGLTQRDLANLTGLTTRGIRKIEREGAKPNFATRFVLAAALGVDPSDLLEGDE